MSYANKRGFSLIELLTVIAIISLLAAIIFPVMSSARARARQGQCITNLSQIQQALKLFRNDNNRYPPVIAGFAEGGGSVPTPLDAIKNGTLFREYIKSVKGLACPDSTVQDMTRVYPDPLGTANLIGLDRKVNGNPGYLYAYSSYDAQVMAYNTDPNLAEPRYTLAWADKKEDLAAINPAADPDLTFMRQLKFRNPPDDTVVTWCGYHRGGSQTPDRSGAIDLVLFLDGHVDRIPSDKLYPNGTSTPWNYPYTIKPKP